MQPAGKLSLTTCLAGLGDGKLSICLADVTGHAMEAAIPVVMFSGVLKTEIRHGAPVEQLFAILNSTLHDALDSRTFVCFAMGELDIATSTMRLANGGCPYPYHYRAATGEIAELEVDAYPLGVRSAATYPVVEVSLEPGDYVVSSKPPTQPAVLMLATGSLELRITRFALVPSKRMLHRWRILLMMTDHS